MMSTQLHEVIHQVKTLNREEQSTLLRIITKSLKANSLRYQNEKYWSKPSIEALIREQQTQPAKNITNLASDFWPEDESIDVFLEYLQKQRQESREGAL